jgi:polar amino acid transport system permease protein
MFDFEFIRNNWLFIAAGTGATLGITISSLLLAIPLAVLVANARRSPFRPLRALGTFYVWLVDGIPLLLQIPFYFLALPQLGILLPGLWAAVVVLVVYYSPRLSALFTARPVSLEHIREGAWRAFLPGIGSEFVSMIKDSTLLSMTGFIHDIYWRSRRVGRAEFHNLEALVVAVVIYLILNTAISLSLGVHKARLLVVDPGVAGSS